MMKTKIIFIGIVLCFIAACGIFSSKKTQKFNPHSLDGLYQFVYHIDVNCKGNSCYQKWYTNYMFVEYPYFHACAARGQGFPYKPIGKEDVKIAHKKGNLYKVKKINGNIVNSNNVTYIITEDSSHFKGTSHYKAETVYYLSFNKIKNGKEHYAVNFINPSPFGGPTNKGYQKCLKISEDTTGIFPSTQGRAIKPK